MNAGRGVHALQPAARLPEDVFEVGPRPKVSPPRTGNTFDPPGSRASDLNDGDPVATRESYLLEDALRAVGARAEQDDDEIGIGDRRLRKVLPVVLRSGLKEGTVLDLPRGPGVACLADEEVLLADVVAIVEANEDTLRVTSRQPGAIEQPAEKSSGGDPDARYKGPSDQRAARDDECTPRITASVAAAIPLALRAVISAPSPTRCDAMTLVHVSHRGWEGDGGTSQGAR